ncbi:MAG: CDP-glucose 4,6-dehydratase [Roseinatronobacter sp.]
MRSERLDPASFAGKSALVTGHTGFKGAWLCLWLARLGARVAGFSIDVPTQPALYDLARISPLLAQDLRGDIADEHAVSRLMDQVRPEIVFHLAAQSLVRESYRDPVTTMATNVMGTITLLEALRRAARPCTVVIVTSDKCYANTGQVWGYRESDPMGGHDPYSASKGMAELAVASWRNSFFPPGSLADHGIRLASVRSGNVLGGGDWSVDRIAVDLVRGFAAGVPVALRNPRAIRPWQHVLDPLRGYLMLAQALQADEPAPFCDGWNFGPSPLQSVDVGTLAGLFADAWGKGAEVAETPDPAAPKEAAVLRLSIDKAVAELGWRPHWDVGQTVTRTVGWYRQVLSEGADAQACCIGDLEAHEQLAD